MSDTVQSNQPADEASGRSTSRSRIGRNSGKLLGQFKVKPNEQSRMSLGSFAIYEPLKGFSIEITPNPDPTNSVVTEILNTGTPQLYKLTLFVSNYGTKPVIAKVRQL